MARFALPPDLFSMERTSMANAKILLSLAVLLGAGPLYAQPVTMQLSDFATPDGGGHPDDQINDHQAFLKAADFFQARHGDGTLILEDGEYIIGKQELWNYGDPSPGGDWNTDGFPGGDSLQCRSMVAYQRGFVLDSCFNFTIHGGTNTTVRYRDCLYYGTFLRDELTEEVSSAVAATNCVTCGHDSLLAWQPDLLHAQVGIMFTFKGCENITVRDLELHGNVDKAILGGKPYWDGYQTYYDGIFLIHSSNTLIDHVNVHHFGKDGLHIFTETSPASYILEHPNTPIEDSTLLFNNTVQYSKFNWNTRQGISWVACAGLTVTDCEMNYTGAGRLASAPSAGLDIEGGGGPFRIRRGVFNDCSFLHNAGAGVHADTGPCVGQQDFKFSDCVFKAGEKANALWPNTRGMKFSDCQIYGPVSHFFEQAEDVPNDTTYNIVFRHTDFREEDDQWNYLWTDTTVWSTICSGNPEKLDLVGGSRTASVTFDSCGFYTNCYGKVRIAGRPRQDTTYPYCAPITCDSCGVQGNTCPSGTCGFGVYLGTDTVPDARYVRAINCHFQNTGRKRCAAQTQLIAVDFATVVNFSLEVPSYVRDSVFATDTYTTPFGTSTMGILGSQPCSFYGLCPIDTTIYHIYGDNFPPCKPFFTLPDSIHELRWQQCDLPGGNIPVAACISDANCYSELTIPDSTHSSAVGSVISTTVFIEGQFFVDQDLSFIGAQVRMAPGAEIIVQAGAFLDIETSTFTACSGIMWKSITAQAGSVVRIRASFMDDAENAITALDSTVVKVDNTQFHNNRVALHVPDSGLAYNDVALSVTNSTFYSQDAMPVPYPGQTTAVGTRGYAAVDVYYMTLDFTGGNNLIHDMSNGIVARGSDLGVADCRFVNIAPDAAYTLAGNGAGINAHGGGGFHSVKQTGFGMNSTPSYENCRWGLYTEYMSVKSRDNQMLDMGTAYRVAHAGFLYVDILDNKVIARDHGVDLRFNDGALHLLVQGNDITFGANDCTANCPGYSGINVEEGNYKNPSSVIRNNTIRFTTKLSSRTGVNLLAADQWVVADNELLMQYNMANQSGIQLNGCNRTDVSCNNISSTDASFVNLRQAAIRNTMGSHARISCNDMDRTANGMLFNGPAPGTDVRGNSINRHKWGLRLTSNAIIGLQVLKGNLWYYDPLPIGGLAAWYQVSNALALQYQFLYNPAINVAPPSWSPPNWFDITFGANYACANDGGDDYCSQFKIRGKEELTELDVLVATDSLENEPYTDETKWMLRRDLYRKLDENADLEDSLEIMTEFHADLQGSTTAAFKAVDDEQFVLYALDSSMAAQLQAKQAEIDTILVLVNEGMEQLGDSSLTVQQRQLILFGISSYREDIAALTADNSSALQVAAEVKVLAAGDAKDANDGIVTTELIEANQKAINNIYLATIGKDVDVFTTEQATTLFDIASQCPMLGGNAVFKARSLYGLIDDTYSFDDSLLCAPFGIDVKRLTTQRINSVSVMPNPASDEATLVFAQELNEPGILIMYDAMGAEVLRSGIPRRTMLVAFSTATLAPALYHYKVLAAGDVIGNGQLTILR